MWVFEDGVQLFCDKVELENFRAIKKTSEEVF
jgi:hypothetical protein